MNMQKEKLISLYQKKIQSNQHCTMLIFRELTCRAKADIIIKNSDELKALDEGNYSVIQNGTNFLLVVNKKFQ
ncbi:MAG: hypothetical protein EAX96_02845 [Candidatus Lokiarchaeota archaeon]|nr:hypothetical protein [Candidatus Lokiarchaeota archaeon]